MREGGDAARSAAWPRASRAAAVGLFGAVMGLASCGGVTTTGSGGGGTAGTSTGGSSTAGTGGTGTAGGMSTGGTVTGGTSTGGSGGQPACDCPSGSACVGGVCAVVCEGHWNCDPASQSCTTAKEDGTGADVQVCLPRPSGVGIGASCPFGTECPAEAPACLSAGEGDPTAYCTIHDCMADADCPAGFYCGITRDPHAVCGANPPKGDNNFCGQTNEACIDPATNPTTIFEGSMCLLRKTCIYRGPCAPCSSDLDCSSEPYRKCATIGGEGRCARLCGDDGDCLDDEACASGACLPKFGACVGSGAFCEPCLNDEDCGSAGTMNACVELSGGQRACFDLGFPDACTTDADCPVAPGGKHGTCFDEQFGFPPGDPLYHKCYLPIDVQTNQTSCW